MNYQKNSSSSNFCNCNSKWYISCEGWESKIRVGDEEDELVTGLRKGPWTEEEDSRLTSAVVSHGVGRWNSLANLAGLKRSGKSCRLRWLNYLRPDLRRGSFTLHEQLLILELHLRWGNRWSKIAEYLPGRTDNEIKNYWRTKVQKLARQFQCQVNSPEFRDALRHVWIPRLVEQIQAQNEGPYNGSFVGLNCPEISEFRAQTYLDEQLFIGPFDMGSKPNSSCETRISTESGSSAELDPDSEQNLDDFLWDITNDDILFLQQQLG